MSLGKIRQFLAGLFFFFLPTQLGYFSWPSWSYFWGIKIDFLSPAVFLTDLILLALFLVWLLELFGSCHFRLFGKDRSWLWPVGGTIVFSLISLGFSFLPPLSGYRVLKWLQLVFLIGYFSANFSAWLLVPLFFSLILVSLLSWGQFLFQGSLQGIFWLLGERFFNLSTPGVAKMSLFGRLFIRPMANFSHPNSLAGFILVTLIIFWFFRQFLAKKLGPFFYFGLALMSTVLIITFSGAVWLAIFGLGFFYLFKKTNRHFWSLPLVVFLFLGGVFLTFWLGLFEVLSFQERLFLAQNAIRLFWERPLLGWGPGSFISAQGQLNFPRGNFNFYQPVHNLFLLILAETGLLGLFWFTYWLRKWWLGVTPYWRRLFLLVIFLGFFDHYWLTLQQNFLLLGVVIAIALSTSPLSTSKVERGEVE